MEDDLSGKMTEFMAVLDQVKKYRALLAALPDFAIIFALSLIAALSVDVVNHLGIVFITYINYNTILPNALTFLALLIGLIVGVFLVNRKMRSVQGGQWKTTLNEGAPGAIKLLQELNWDNVYAEIRYAKLGFWLYGLLKTVVYWLLAFFVSLFAAEYLGNAIHWNVNLSIVALFSLALVLALSKNDFQKRYDQVGRLDALLWELRWFDNEFRRTNFEA